MNPEYIPILIPWKFTTQIYSYLYSLKIWKLNIFIFGKNLNNEYIYIRIWWKFESRIYFSYSVEIWNMNIFMFVFVENLKAKHIILSTSFTLTFRCEIKTATCMGQLINLSEPSYLSQTSALLNVTPDLVFKIFSFFSIET